MSAKPRNALDEARAAFVLASISRDGIRLGFNWYAAFRDEGFGRAVLDRAINQLADSGVILIEVGPDGLYARRIEGPTK
jgi:hypothetical protein